ILHVLEAPKRSPAQLDRPSKRIWLKVESIRKASLRNIPRTADDQRPLVQKCNRLLSLRRDLSRYQRGWRWRFSRPAAAARLPAGPRGDGNLAASVSADAGTGRRLRRFRLLRGGSPPRIARRFRRVYAGLSSLRPAGIDRSRRKSHFGSAPVVSGGAQRPEVQITQVVPLVQEGGSKKEQKHGLFGRPEIDVDVR